MVKKNMKRFLSKGLMMGAAVLFELAVVLILPQRVFTVEIPEAAEAVFSVELAAFFAPQTVYAAVHSDALDDAADLLTDAEESALLEQIEELENATGWKVFVLTTADADGRSSQAYADDYVDTHAFEQDGVCYLIDMDNREVAISTTGKAISVINDNAVEDILDAGYGRLGTENYSGCFRNMMDETLDCYKSSLPGLSIIDIVVALIAALAAGGITGGVIIGSYRLKFDSYHYDYKKNSRVHLAEKEDRLVNEFVTHRHIERSSSGSSSGGSTTHKSSGGGTHGGGSRKF